jgi:hypothetical protein
MISRHQISNFWMLDFGIEAELLKEEIRWPSSVIEEPEGTLHANSVEGTGERQSHAIIKLDFI